ncbi:MAG: DegV family EDD domain-containing protein [Deltaproteobacteria bacterium]|nr:DegV family EDD domain-containing protein [Deltaproteobacteria bacterium]
MTRNFKKAFISGVERVAAWSDILDEINVFPVADGDTGRNLVISMTPLRQFNEDPENTINKLLISARGNSGNIAARFFSGFLKADSFTTLLDAVESGRDKAWQAVNKPVAGTMLTVFDELAEFLKKDRIEDKNEYVLQVINHLEKATLSTNTLLPKLKQAGVIDSGALGMYIFFESFFSSLIDRQENLIPITKKFKGFLQIAPSFQEKTEAGYCIDTVVKFDNTTQENISKLSECGESVVAIKHEDYIKVHLHTGDREEARKKIESLGDVVNWADDDMDRQIKKFKRQGKHKAIHIMTDAAGSVTREDSSNLKFTLLDSYIIAGDKSLPETHFRSSELYKFMREGVKVTTSQASVFERHQYYQRLLDQYKEVLYICVGSVYTGNYDTVREWKKKNDPDNRLTVIDTGVASGRLGIIAIATARHSMESEHSDSVIRYAKRAVDLCDEYIFLDKLKYLAAGGRLSKTNAVFGDMFNVKPIIRPTSEGAKKVGAVRNRKGQLKFALDKIEKTINSDSSPLIMLQYTDNRSWVENVVKEEIIKLLPLCEIILQPLSLTTGAHTGPGTWALAFLPKF